MRLKNKVAIVTGGGSGLGKETCLLFAKEGATVVVADYNFESAEAVEHEIIVNGGSALAVNVNVTDRSSVDKMVQTVIEHYGKIDILINNAGITMDKTLLKMTQEQWQNVIDVNLTGVFNCGQAVAPYMVKNGYGSIINTSSVVALYSNVGQSNYSATKAGVIALAKTWAKELGRKGVRSNAVAPGFIATPMTELMPEEVLKSMEDKVPMKRLGKPSEVANVYLFLASDESSYINGSVISVDGGVVI